MSGDTASANSVTSDYWTAIIVVDLFNATWTRYCTIVVTAYPNTPLTRHA